LDEQGRLWQALRDDDALRVEIYAVPDEGLSGTPREIQERLAERGFDVTVDLPLRVALVEVGSSPRGVVIAVSHAAADILSLHVIESTLSGLLRGMHGDSSVEESSQPFEQASFEQSAAGRRSASRAMRAWRTTLESMPRTLLVADRRSPAAPGRFWLGELRSRLLHSSSTVLAERYRTTTSVVTLAAVAVALGQYAGAPLCPMGLVFSNRTNKGLRGAVGNLAQITCAVIDVSGESFGDVVDGTRRAALASYLQGPHDSVALQATHAQLEHRRGSRLRYASIFSDIRTGADQESPAPAEAEHAGSDDEGSSISVLKYEDGDYLDCMFILWSEEPGWLRLHLKADTTLYPPDDARRLLKAVEAILVTATSDSDMAAVRASTGLRSPDRNEDWLMVERCWTYLPAVERLVRAAVSRAHVKVVVERPAGGEPVLVAHVIPAGGAITPEEAHTACVALLDAHPTAVTPHQYVLYAHTTAGHETGEFRGRTVTAAGPGR
jgi:hypothetical protein